MNCARWDLCGGYWVTDIPTAILGHEQTFLSLEIPRPPSCLGEGINSA